MAKGMNIAIVGAGIAGCTAARVLRERHSVTLFEKVGCGHELGAPINIGPNGNQFLDRLGFDRTRSGSIVVGTTVTRLKDGVVVQESQHDTRQAFGADWTFQHRADLWQELYRLTTAPSKELNIGGDPAKVEFGTEVVSIDAESGIVKFADGHESQYDMIVGADGIKSAIRPQVVGEKAFTTARPAGQSAFRFLMPREDFEKIAPGHPILDKDQPARLEIYVGGTIPMRSIICYPCRNHELINFGAIVDDNLLTTKTTESWTAEGNVQEMLSCFEDFGELPRKLLSQAQNVKLWQLRDQDPLPTYIKGRAVLIGDAAHPMTPHQGQGGTQAVEDAEAFCLFNGPSVTREDVPDILKNFDRVRRLRASQIQKNTRAVHEHKTPESIWAKTSYNFTYPGVEECLRRLEKGEEMIQIRSSL